MADAVTTQVIMDGEHTAIMKFTNLSDATGETNVVKVDVSALAPSAAGGACIGVTLARLKAMVFGMEVQLKWAADTPQMLLIIPQGSNYVMEFDDFGGIPNNAGAGKTGDITFTTQNAGAGDSYSIILRLWKHYANPRG